MKRENKVFWGRGGGLSSMNSTMSPGVGLPGIPQGDKSEPEADNGDGSHIYEDTWVEKTLHILEAQRAWKSVSRRGCRSGIAQSEKERGRYSPGSQEAVILIPIHIDVLCFKE